MPNPVDKLCVLSKSIWSLPSYPSNPLHFKLYSNIHTSSYSAIPHTAPCPLSLLSAPDPIPRWAATPNLLLEFFFTFTPTHSLLRLFRHIYEIVNTNLNAPLLFSLCSLHKLYGSAFICCVHFDTCSTVWRVLFRYHCSHTRGAVNALKIPSFLSHRRRN